MKRHVPLEYDGVLRVESRSHDGRHLTPTQPEAVLELRDVNPVVTDSPVADSPVGEPEQQFTVYFCVALQPESSEQVVGVVDRAVVGAYDVSRTYRVVVSADFLMAPRSPARVTEQERCTVVDVGQDLAICLVEYELRGRYRPLEQPVAAVALEPGYACGVRTSTFARQQKLREQISQVTALTGATTLLSQDDSYLSAHQDFPPFPFVAMANPWKMPWAYLPRWDSIQLAASL